MENQTAPDIATRAMLRVFDRTTQSEKEMPVNQAEMAVSKGWADLVGPGSLPHKSARPGTPTLGDGFGFAFVIPAYAPTTTIKVSLMTAMRMISNGIGRYAMPDGSAPAIDHEPPLVADAEPVLTDAPATSIASKLRRRLASSIL